MTRIILLLNMMNGKRVSARAIWLLVFLCAALPAAGQEVRLLEHSSSVEVSFVWPKAPSSASEALIALKSKGFEPALPPGNPEVPSRTLRIAIPPEGEATWTVGGVDEVRLKEPLPLRAGADRDWDPRPAEMLPSSAIEFAGEGWFRQVRFLTFRLHPMRPGADGAVLIRGMTLTVSFPPSTGAAVHDHPAFDSAYARLFVNEWRDKGRNPGSRAAWQQGSEITGKPNEERLSTSDQGQRTKDALNYDQRTAPNAVPASTPYRPTLAPGSSAYKIKVRTAGLYRLDYSFFLARNIPVNNLSNLHIQNLGADVAIYVDDKDLDNILDSNEAVYFYGVPYTGEEGDWNQPSDLWQHGDYTDENVYWVYCGTTAGARMTMRLVTPRYSSDASRFMDSRPFEQNTLYRPFDPVRNDDLWLWQDASWDKGTPDIIQRADHLITVPSVDGSTGTASLSLTVRGRTSDSTVNPDHQVQVSVNGAIVGSFAFDGQLSHTASFSFPQARLLNGTQVNTVRVEVTDPAFIGLNTDAIQTNRFTLNYNRKYEAVQNLLAFPVGTDAVDYPIRAFTSNDIKGVDATNPANPVWLFGLMIASDGANYKATLYRGANVSGTPTYVLAVPVAPASADVTQDQPSDLLASASGKNWILVSPPQWTGHTSVTALAAQRSAQGYAPLVVSTEDIYDEFSYGLMSPLALRAFFDAAYHLTSPSDLIGAVLLGDGTLDYKNNAGFGAQNLVPAFMVHDETGGTFLVPMAQYAWDDYYACVEGSDLIPDFYLGRVPAETSADVTNTLNKILNFSAPADPTYQKGNVLVAGCRDGDQWDVYQDQNAALVSPAPPHTVGKMYYRGAPWNCTKTDTDGDGIFDFNEALTDAFNAGQGIVSYIGHGGFDFWDDHSILTMADLTRMTNAARPAVVLNADCYTSAFFFSFANPAILEAMMTSSGGSAASGGPGGFMYNFQSGFMTQPFYETFYGLEKERLTGALFHAVIAEVESTGDERATKGYVELGDPLSAFALPTLGPPLDLQALVDCRSVSLTWGPPAAGGAANYRVFRAGAAQGPWTLLGEIATGLTYTDATGIYGQTYYYRLAARDNAGYEGQGSAVVIATLTPCAPLPPAAPICQDPGFGGRLIISWEFSSEPEVNGYQVVYGPPPDNYLWSTGVLSENTIVLKALHDGSPYAISVRAVNHFGLVSAPSPPSICLSSHIAAWAPPRMVYPLTLSKSSAGLPRLTWKLPEETIWGDTVSIDNCSVYRSTDPNFVPDRTASSLDRAATVTSNQCLGNVCDFVDNAGGAIEYYYIACQTPIGEESAVSKELPGPPSATYGCDTLFCYCSLVWDNVNSDILGRATQVVEYQIFRDPLNPLFAPDPMNGSNLINTTSALEYFEEVPTCREMHYKVMAVDEKGNVGPY